MNTRLQVEHPVTEMRTGLDLVREQIRVAEGNKLSLSQEDVTFAGHAVECRIYAEDSFNNFFPSSGKIVYLRTPTGLGIREERGVEEGSIISTYYDPMIAKLIAWGRDRTEALNRMSVALSHYEVYGVKNNVDLCLWVINHSKFRSGNFDTDFLNQNFAIDKLERSSDEYLKSAALAAIFMDQQKFDGGAPSMNHRPTSRWRTKNIDFMM